MLMALVYIGVIVLCIVFVSNICRLMNNFCRQSNIQDSEQMQKELEHREKLLKDLREFKEKVYISPPDGSSSVPNNDGRIISSKRKRIRMRFGSRINFFYSLRKIIRQCRFCGR